VPRARAFCVFVFCSSCLLPLSLSDTSSYLCRNIFVSCFLFPLSKAQGALKNFVVKGGVYLPDSRRGRQVRSFFLEETFLMAFLCVSQQGELKKNQKNVLEKVHVKEFLQKV
jgi:hypothetical protein